MTVEYAGDFQGLDMAPVTTSVLKGILTPIIKDDVNFVNAPGIASERGIKVLEATSPDPKEYVNLITVKTVTTQAENTVSGTIFGKNRLQSCENKQLQTGNGA